MCKQKASRQLLEATAAATPSRPIFLSFARQFFFSSSSTSADAFWQSTARAPQATDGIKRRRLQRRRRRRRRRWRRQEEVARARASPLLLAGEQTVSQKERAASFNACRCMCAACARAKTLSYKQRAKQRANARQHSQFACQKYDDEVTRAADALISMQRQQSSVSCERKHARSRTIDRAATAASEIICCSGGAQNATEAAR